MAVRIASTVAIVFRKFSVVSAVDSILNACWVNCAICASYLQHSTASEEPGAEWKSVSPQMGARTDDVLHLLLLQDLESPLLDCIL